MLYVLTKSTKEALQKRKEVDVETVYNETSALNAKE